MPVPDVLDLINNRLHLAFLHLYLHNQFGTTQPANSNACCAMSRQKRPARGEPSEDGDSISSSPPQYSSSVPGSEGRKRRRISVGSETTPEQPQDNGNAEDSDLSGDSSTDEEALEEQATQVLRRKRARDKDAREAGDLNSAREYGVIESVELINFMCHENFKYEFGPNINFICGRNGSGKSAVLTALILCLGGKASTTNRGKGLKEFIRHGCDKARIIVKLKNEGQSAYQNEEYGDSLFVERSFTASGASGYSIKTASGRKISDKRSDLDPILDHFDLQVDNPLNVLSQDNARQFIGTSKASDKYKMFVKGVQLERLDEDYRLLEDRIDGSEQKLARKKEDIKILQEEKEEKERIRKLAEKRDNLRQKMKELRRQLGWLQVRRHEQELADFDGQFAEADDLIQSRENEVESWDRRLRDADAAFETTGTALNQAKAALDAAEDDKRQLDNAFSEARDEATEKQHEQKQLQQQLSTHRDEKQRLEKDIAEEERRLDDINGGGAARRRRERDEAQEAAETARAEYQVHQSRKVEVEGEYNAKKAALKEKYDARTAAEKRVGEARERVNQVRNADDNISNRAFRKNTEQLLQLIARETRWQSRPLGPLGRHVKLLKPEWSLIVEKVFGRSLSGFLVTTKHDMNLLSRLKKQANCDCELYLLIDRREITLREPDDQFLSVLRALEIDSPEVQKHLVIAHAIEQAILIPDMEDATRAMYHHGRLRNVRGCYTFHARIKNKGILLRYGSDNSASQDPVEPYQGPPRMKGDMRAAIIAAQASFEQAQEHLTSAKAEWLEARKVQERAKFQYDDWKPRNDQLRLAMQEADDKLGDLNDQIAQDNVEGGKLAALKDSLNELNERMQLTEGLFQDAYNAYKEKAGVMREKNRARNEHDAILEEVKQRHAHAETEHRANDTSRSHLVLEKNKAVHSVGDAKSERTNLEQKKAAKAEEVRGVTAQCQEQLGDRVPVPDNTSYEATLKKYEKMRDDLENQHRRHRIPLDQATRDLANATTALKNAEKDSVGFLETQELLQASLNDRRARWLKFRQFITARAKVQFVHLLSQRGFRGNLLIDHPQRRLDVTIEPDITRRNDRGRAAQTLSGGEKSYAQICMLLSIWDAMGSPLRCLDEFDVYMDAVNRSTSIRMIIDCARESAGRQYILISPGSKADYPKDDDVHVQELNPPERGQQDIRQAMRSGADSTG